MNVALAEPTSGTDAVAGLIRGLAAEVTLLRELRAALLEQRDALARDNAGDLELVVQQIGRTLVALRETRRLRATLLEAVTGARQTALADAGASLEPPQAAAFEAACRELHYAAVAAHRELDINQAVLRRAIETGEQYLQQVLTAPVGTATPASYAAGDAAPVGSGLFLNQRA